jgi:hypothetical protein
LWWTKPGVVRFEMNSLSAGEIESSSREAFSFGE